MQMRLIAAACLFALTACADSPTSSAGAPQEPRRSETTGGGWTAGSGNKVQPAPDTTSTSPTTTMDDGACEADERSGWTAGSGYVGCVQP